MPDQSTNQTALRADEHLLLCYLSVYKGSEVFQATVTATPTDQALDLAVTAVSGDASDVKAGYRVDVYSSGGEFKGRTRIRYAGTISSTNLPIREHSQGVARIVAGDTVKVYNDVRLSDKLVSATADFNPDHLSITDQGSNPPPIACSGGAWAGWDWMLPAPFTGSTSDWVDPDSNGPLSHAWVFPTGLTADDDDVADVNVIAADAGEYLIEHTVTDDDNSKSTTQYVPMIVHDDENPPYEVVVEDISGTEETGHTFLIRVFDDALLTDIPDGAFCILWKEEYINGVRQSFGVKSPGRSHILGVGYIRREEGSFDGESGVEELRFEVISPLARLDELLGYSKVMTNTASPDSWMEMKTLGVERAFRQIVQFYTNLVEAGFDLVTDSNFSDALYPEFYLQESTPLAQIRELVHGRKARFVCDRTGRFSVHTRPELLAVSSRASATKTITLDSNDIIDWRYTREHWRSLSLITVMGFTAGHSGNAAIFSRWPGLAPNVGNRKETVERQIESSQAALNVSAGQWGAASDGIYQDENGVMQTALDLELTLPGSYHVADFYDEYVAINLTTSLRGLDLSDQLFVLRSVRLEIGEDGAAQCVWTLRTATAGASGATYIPPSEDENGFPDWTPPDFNWDFDPLPDVIGGITPNPWLPAGTGTLAMVLSDGTLAITNNFSDASPNWTTYALGLSGTLLDSVVDAFSPNLTGTGTAVNIWVVTSTHFYYIEDIFNARTVNLKHTFAASSTARMVSTERGIRNRVAVSSYYGGGNGVKMLWSTDNSTFTETTVTTNSIAGGFGSGFSFVHVSGRVANQVYVTAYNASGQPRLFRTNLASTPLSFTDITPAVWTDGSFGIGLRTFWVPYDESSDDSIYYCAGPSGSSIRRTGRHTPSGDTRVDLVTDTHSPGLLRKSLSACPIEPASLIATATVDGGGYVGLYVSRTFGSSWTQISTSNTYRQCDMAGNDANVAYAWGTNGTISYIELSGVSATIHDKRGDLATSATVVNIFGG